MGTWQVHAKVTSGAGLAEKGAALDSFVLL